MTWRGHVYSGVSCCKVCPEVHDSSWGSYVSHSDVASSFKRPRERKVVDRSVIRIHFPDVVGEEVRLSLRHRGPLSVTNGEGVQLLERLLQEGLPTYHMCRNHSSCTPEVMYRLGREYPQTCFLKNTQKPQCTQTHPPLCPLVCPLVACPI